MFLNNILTEHEGLTLLLKAVESARNGIVITDPNQPDNPIIYTNPAFTEITGYDAAEILGKNCRFLQGTDKDQEGLNDVRKSLESETPVTAVLRNYRKDGALFHNELTVSPVRDESGRLIAFIGIQNDITARKEAERRISDFYSVVSHELRTPIAKIKSSLAVVADGEAGQINETAEKFVRISANAADSLWKLVENILDFKKLESGQFRLSFQNLLLGDLIRHAVADFTPVAEAAGAKILFNCRENPRINADGERLVQVMENLLSNAVKFCPKNSSVEVTVKSAGGGKARVEVKDSGPGIAPCDLNKLFVKFQQLHSPDNRSRGGTGLGLAICKAIVEAHGGQIGAESKPGQGTTFWFELTES